jgi:hypothetical protein
MMRSFTTRHLRRVLFLSKGGRPLHAAFRAIPGPSRCQARIPPEDCRNWSRGARNLPAVVCGMTGASKCAMDAPDAALVAWDCLFQWLRTEYSGEASQSRWSGGLSEVWEDLGCKEAMTKRRRVAAAHSSLSGKCVHDTTSGNG